MSSIEHVQGRKKRTHLFIDKNMMMRMRTRTMTMRMMMTMRRMMMMMIMMMMNHLHHPVARNPFLGWLLLPFLGGSRGTVFLSDHCGR